MVFLLNVLLKGLDTRYTRTIFGFCVIYKLTRYHSHTHCQDLISHWATIKTSKIIFLFNENLNLILFHPPYWRNPRWRHHWTFQFWSWIMGGLFGFFRSQIFDFSFRSNWFSIDICVIFTILFALSLKSADPIKPKSCAVDLSGASKISKCWRRTVPFVVLLRGTF